MLSLNAKHEAPEPLNDTLALEVAHLATVRGRFALAGENLDGVMSDGEAILAWLGQYRDSPHTFRAYKRHVRVLLEWLQARRLAPTDLTRPLARDFAAWSRQPPPVDVGEGRAFSRFPSAASYNQRLAACSSLYAHMQQSGYIAGNPFAGVSPQPVAAPLARRFRSLDEDMIAAVDTQIALEDAAEQARLRLVFHGVIRLGARRSEMASARLRDLARDPKGRWWWNVVGKGGKPAVVPVHPDVIEALRQWRAARGLPPGWLPQDDGPIFPGAHGGFVSPDAHYKHIKSLFAAAAERLPDEQRERLLRASPHWLRHTALTRLAAVMPVQMLKEFARHSRIETTAIYTNPDPDHLHDIATGAR